MIIEALGSLLFLGGLLAIAVSITAVDEHRQRKRARESERRAIRKIKEEKKEESGVNIEERLELHQKWIRNEPGGARLEEHGANLREANLRGADLWEADLREADLRGANLDYACWPLWCGSIGVKIDKRIWCQLAYHLCAVEIDDPDCIRYRNMLLPIANHFHRVEECGVLEEIKEV